VFTTQRSKSLNQIISRRLDSASPTKTNRTAIADSLFKSSEKARRTAEVHAVRVAVHSILDIMSSTVGLSRVVFGDKNGSNPALMRLTLAFVETDGTSPDAQALPDSLRLSTSRLLGKLTSSAHTPLPHAIKSYKPYIDSTSNSTSVKQQDLAAKLNGWFRSSLDQLSSALHEWISGLRSARQIWSLLSWFRKHVEASTYFQDDEKSQLCSAMELVCKKRIVSIWTSTLKDQRDVFRAHLQSALTDATIEKHDSGKLLFYCAMTVRDRNRQMFKLPSRGTSSRLSLL
jgi:conserved oligomeric Golgi complex subunit 1